MAKVYWPYFDPEYENLSSRINPPSVSIDNTSCKECTLVKVDSMNKPGILLEVVQVLTDLDLTITKAYISSDGGWFMDVFHVTDQQGNKVTDSKTIDYIEKVLGPKGHAASSQNTWPGKRVGVHSLGDHTSIEIIARDRPGLLSEISAVLADLHFNVVAAEAWTHNRRIACVLYVNDNETSRAVDDPERLSAMEEQLNLVIRGSEQEDEKVARTSLSIGSTHVDRRLHQMLFADRDYDAVSKVDGSGLEPKITVEHCEEKGYSVISVSCEDRAKLMFDIVCTLTDMQYIVFHATITSSGPHASQEYFIRHKDGCTLDSEGEKERVIKCLEAAIHRRVSEGWSLELCAKDRVGLLSEVTRILREHGLSVTRAGVTTVGEQAVNVFYVRDASGNPVDVKTIEALRGEIGHSMMINVKNKVPSRRWKQGTKNVSLRLLFISGDKLSSKLSTFSPDPTKMEEPTSSSECGITIIAKPRKKNPKTLNPQTQPPKLDPTPQFEKFTSTDATTSASNFESLGLSEWASETCKELGMRKPTPVQTHCIPKILSGRDVLGLAQTGSGKTAAFALPILNRLAEDPYGVFALVVTPTRELAFQLAEQFKALGSCLNLRCCVIVGGMDMLTQTRSLISRPHVVITTPGRIKVLLENNPDVPPVFSRTKFLVLDEADRVLDVGFQDELRTIFNCLPKTRQTLLFSATMTSNLQTLLEHSSNKAYFYEAYEGLKTVDTLKQQYIFIDKDAKELYLVHILSQMEDKEIRSAMIFVSTCRTCQRLSLMLEELEVENAALHSLNSQSLRLSALSKFKSGKVPILLATDVASRGLDIPTVDLVINYDIPRYPRDYVHRVGRTARAGRGGLAVSIITETDVNLIHEIEAEVGKQMELYNYREITDSLEVTKVSKAKRVAMMKMLDDGFEDKVKDRKKLKRKTLADKGMLKKRSKTRKSAEEK